MNAFDYQLFLERKEENDKHSERISKSFQNFLENCAKESKDINEIMVKKMDGKFLLILFLV